MTPYAETAIFEDAEALVATGALKNRALGDISDALADKGFLVTSTAAMIAWARSAPVHCISCPSASPAAPSK